MILCRRAWLHATGSDWSCLQYPALSGTAGTVPGVCEPFRCIQGIQKSACRIECSGGGTREETGTGDNRMDGYPDSCCSTFVSLESLSCLSTSVYGCYRIMID